jgi:hypothetical protein
MKLLRWLGVEDWKRGVAFVILYAYGYQLCAWPLLSWATTLLTAFTGHALPVPPIVPWEHLAAGTGTLATIGGIQTWRERGHAEAPNNNPPQG